MIKSQDFGMQRYKAKKITATYSKTKDGTKTFHKTAW